MLLGGMVMGILWIYEAVFFMISAECQGSALREFPGQYLNPMLGDLRSDANDGMKDARKALKLLNESRFKK